MEAAPSTVPQQRSAVADYRVADQEKAKLRAMVVTHPSRWLATKRNLWGASRCEVRAAYPATLAMGSKAPLVLAQVQWLAACCEAYGTMHGCQWRCLAPSKHAHAPACRPTRGKAALMKKDWLAEGVDAFFQVRSWAGQTCGTPHADQEV